MCCNLNSGKGLLCGKLDTETVIEPCVEMTDWTIAAYELLSASEVCLASVVAE